MIASAFAPHDSSEAKWPEADEALSVAPRVCERMAFLLDWSTQFAQDQLASFSQEAGKGMAWRGEAETETIRQT